VSVIRHDCVFSELFTLVGMSRNILAATCSDAHLLAVGTGEWYKIALVRKGNETHAGLMTIFPQPMAQCGQKVGGIAVSGDIVAILYTDKVIVSFDIQTGKEVTRRRVFGPTRCITTLYEHFVVSTYVGLEMLDPQTLQTQSLLWERNKWLVSQMTRYYDHLICVTHDRKVFTLKIVGMPSSRGNWFIDEKGEMRSRFRRTCEACGARGTKRCLHCQSVWYCSVECQRLEWEQHQRKCKLR